jgi:hypothetical protein
VPFIKTKSRTTRLVDGMLGQHLAILLGTGNLCSLMSESFTPSIHHLLPRSLKYWISLMLM